jgi:hypothetical protein
MVPSPPPPPLHPPPTSTSFSSASSSSSSCYCVGSQKCSYRAYPLHLFKISPPLRCPFILYCRIIPCQFIIHSIQTAYPDVRCLCIIFFIFPLFEILLIFVFLIWPTLLQPLIIQSISFLLSLFY